MAASVFHMEAASSCLHGRAGREVLPEWRTGNDASCPGSGTPPISTGGSQCQSSGRHRLPSTKQRHLRAGAQLGVGRGGVGLHTNGWGNRTAFLQVLQNFHGRWLRGGRQLSSSPAGVAGPFTPSNHSASTTVGTDDMVPDGTGARDPSLLAWGLAEGRDPVARLAAALAGTPLCLRAPAALRSWLAALVAAAACVAGAVLVSRLLPTATTPFALAMGLMGDFGEVGPRRRLPGVQPAIKKQKAIEMEGQVQKALPNAMFQVSLDNGCQVLAHISGKIRRNRIEIFQGDRVKVEISPYDLTRGRITHRNRRAGQGGPAPPGGGPPGGPSTPGTPAPA